MKSSATRTLINVLEGKEPSWASVNSLIDIASKNKVLLHLLRALNIQGSLREKQESDLRRVIQVVQALSRLLKGYDYAFFKLIKPASYVPADVDLPVNIRQAKRAAKEIIWAGYRVAVKDPYCITFTRAASIIDL